MSLFIDPDEESISKVKEVGADRIELYTGPYAEAYGSEVKMEKLINLYSKAATHAHHLGLGVNAGHDLDLFNLGPFLKKCKIDEVSIGHALISDSLKFGMSKTVKKYLHLCKWAKIFIMDIEKEIKEQINSNPILLYMKGSPDAPQCGFSSRATQLLIACGKPFSFVDILSNPEIRANLPKVSNWPTFPQLFVNGELVGGSDIMTELHESGDLKELINSADQGS